MVTTMSETTAKSTLVKDAIRYFSLQGGGSFLHSDGQRSYADKISNVLMTAVPEHIADLKAAERAHGNVKEISGTSGSVLSGNSGSTDAGSNSDSGTGIDGGGNSADAVAKALANAASKK